MNCSETIYVRVFWFFSILSGGLFADFEPPHFTPPHIDPDVRAAVLQSVREEIELLKQSQPQRVLTPVVRKRPLEDLDTVPESWNVVSTGRRKPSTKAIRNLQVRRRDAVASNLKYVPDQYIITLKDADFPFALRETASGLPERVHKSGVTLAEFAEVITEVNGGEVYWTWDYGFTGFSARLTPEQAKQLRMEPSVECVAIDRIGEFHYERDYNDLPTQYNYIYSLPWNLDRIDEDKISSEDVYRYPYKGSGVHAYVIDTGIHGTHVEFSGRLGSSYSAEGDSAFVDNINHGTGVASILGGQYLGVAPGVIIHSVKISDDNDYSTCDAIECMNWIFSEIAYSTDPAICNMSFGFNVAENDITDDDDSACASLASFENVVRSLVNLGVSVIASAGNEDLLYPADFTPARMSEVITVSSFGTNDSISPMTRGPGTDIFAPGGYPIPWAFPDPVDNYKTSVNHGTSLAAPAVAGVAAGYLEKYPNATPTDVKNFIILNSLSGKLSGNLKGAPDRMLHCSDWWYPYHNKDEWANSDTIPSESHYFITLLMGPMWTSYSTDYPFFFRYSDSAWVEFIEDTPSIMFINWSEPGHPTETYAP